MNDSRSPSWKPPRRRGWGKERGHSVHAASTACRHSLSQQRAARVKRDDRHAALFDCLAAAFLAIHQHQGEGDLATLALGLEGDNPRKGNVTLAMAAVAGVTALDVLCAQQLTARRAPTEVPVWDYSDRSGLPRAPMDMRGAARDFEPPEDMRIPEPLRPYTDA